MSEFAVERSSKLGNYIDNASWFWNCKAKRIVKITLTCVFTFLSILILFGEILSIFSGHNINPFRYALDDDSNHILGTQVNHELIDIYQSYIINLNYLFF